MAPAQQTALLPRGLDALGRRGHAALVPLVPLVPPALLLADAVLCALVLYKVPYTEIDWTAYMEQVAQVVSGARDYPSIRGATGPLVYPAAHVYLYAALYYLTDHGTDIFRAQQLFALVYLATVAAVMACYRQARAPLWLFPLLVLSKRLHSIFLLRCFNDAWAALLLWLALLLLQRRRFAAAALAYTLGLGVKMSLLLGLPALGAVLLLGQGPVKALRLAGLMAAVQAALAAPFLAANARGYLGRAFDLSRRFLFRWTVNWRFVGEDVFRSGRFAAGLLVLHAAVLAALATRRWLRPAGVPVLTMARRLLGRRSPFTEPEQRAAARRVTPDYVLTTVLTAVVVGMLFARSLHYQFYAYLAWATPWLLWRAGLPRAAVYGLWAAQEWAWNVYPSTPLSSAVVVGLMAVTVGLVWRAGEAPPGSDKDAARKQ